jgi:hypothetical protein
MTYDIDKIAFESKEPTHGYTVKASYLKGEQKSDALVEIMKDGNVVRYFLFPAYKVWNIAAHFEDIVQSEIGNNMDGYEEAAATGI